MTAEEHCKQLIGQMTFEIATLKAQLESAQEKIKELEAKQVGHDS